MPGISYCLAGNAFFEPSEMTEHATVWEPRNRLRFAEPALRSKRVVLQ